MKSPKIQDNAQLLPQNYKKLMRSTATLISFIPARRWLFTFVVLLSSHVYGLGMGEIRVSSNLGQPLRAQVEVVEAAGIDMLDLKAKIASADEYRKSGMQFPEGIKFRLKLTQASSQSPQIEISTLRSLDEPFLELLVELTSSSGKMSRSYTVLLDPAPDLIATPATQQPIIGETASESVALEQPTPVIPVAKRSQQKTGNGPTATQVRSSMAVRPIKKKQRAVARTLGIDSGRNGGDASTKTTQFGKLSLTLSTSLTISRNAPGLPLSAPESADAVQEELIAREKTLGELNAQIAEMKEVIKALQGRLGIQPASSVTAGEMSAVLGVSAVESAVADVPLQSAIALTTVVSAVSAAAPEVRLIERNWVKPVIGGLLIAVALGLVVFWYRRRQQAYEWYEGPFDESVEGPDSMTDTVQITSEPANNAGSTSGKMPKAVDIGSVSGKMIVKQELVGDTSMKIPAYQKQKLESNVPPEYDMLEEADVYLRFGHDKLAEEVLLEAIQVNPNNPHAYLTLLGIYASREDTSAFFTWAQKVKALGDAKAWKEVTEMGLKLEPANPFYH